MKKIFTFLLITIPVVSTNIYADANSDFQTAVNAGDLARIMIALKSGANNVNVVDGTGQTALHYAVAKGDVKSVLTLAKHGAKSTIKETHYNRTVIDLVKYQLLEIGKALINNPKDAPLIKQAIIYTQIFSILYSIQFKVV